MSQHGSFPGRPRGRRARPDNDVPEWAGYDAVPQDQREFPDLSPIRDREARAPGQAPWENQPWTQQAPPQPHPRQPQQPQPQQSQPQPQPQPQSPRGGASDWADPADADPMEAFSERWHRRGSESRDDRRADRRKRRRTLIVGGGAAAVVIAVAVYFLTGSNGNSANLGLNSLVTTFLPGELQQVPDACTSVPGRDRKSVV